MNTEKYLPIFGFEEFYEVSDAGEVRSKDRKVIRGNNTIQNWKSRRIKQNILNSGYYSVHLCKNGVSYGRTVHSLVVEAFILSGKVPKGMCCNHINGNKLDNRLGNLEVVTIGRNLTHAHEIGLNNNIGETHYKAIIKSSQLPIIKKMRLDGKTSIEIGKIFGVHRTTINDITSGRKRKSG